MVGRIIKNDSDISEGVAFLSALDERFSHAVGEIESVPLRLREDGFEALLNAIVSQQVSVASARAIMARLTDAGLTQEANIRSATDEQLRSCGLSKQKIRYANELAKARVDFAELRKLPTSEVVQRLVVIPGIGTWTAEIYAMFSLGRADVFAPGDLALQEAARILFELPARPNEKELRTMAEVWSPWRGVAARILFTYYHVAKDREGIS